MKMCTVPWNRRKEEGKNTTTLNDDTDDKAGAGGRSAGLLASPGMAMLAFQRVCGAACNRTT